MRVFAKLLLSGKGSSAGSAPAEFGFIPKGALKENRKVVLQFRTGVIIPFAPVLVQAGLQLRQKEDL
jgi:hypothetical protein